MRPVLVDVFPIDIPQHNLLSIHRSFGKNLAVRARDKTLSPEFNPLATDWLLVTDAIGDGDIAAVGNSMATLDRFPGRMLRVAEFLFLARVPTDCRRIKNNFCAVECRKPGRFRIPLVPANTHADVSALRLPRPKSEI